MTLQHLLGEIVGARNVLTAPEDTKPYFTDWRRQYSGHAECVVRPASTGEVSHSAFSARLTDAMIADDAAVHVTDARSKGRNGSPDARAWRLSAALIGRWGCGKRKPSAQLRPRLGWIPTWLMHIFLVASFSGHILVIFLTSKRFRNTAGPLS